MIKQEIKDYLQSTYNEQWMHAEKSERVYEYISEEEAEDFEGDFELAYNELCTGQAIESDIFGEIANDIKAKFSIDIYAADIYDKYQNFIDSLIEVAF